MSPNFNLSKTVHYCLDSVAWAEPKHLNKKCITTLRDCVLLMTVEQEESLFSDLEVCERILYLLNRLYRLKNWKVYNMVLTVVERMAKLSSANFVAAGGVKTLIKHLKKYGVLRNLKILQELCLDGQFHEEYSKNFRSLVNFYLACGGRPGKLQFITSILLLNLGSADSESLYLQIMNSHLKSMIQTIDPKLILLNYLDEDMLSFLEVSSFDARLLWGLKLIGKAYHYMQFFVSIVSLKTLDLRLKSLEDLEDLEVRERVRMLRRMILRDIKWIAYY